jgi:hypothetical protein
MKYGPDLLEKIVKGLEEVPNIRHVFGKLGIHRSTYYRWFTIHPDFREKVTFALYRGRGNITDMAEGNVIRKIKEGDLPASRFWLSHHEPRYMNEEKHLHHSRLHDHLNKMSEKDTFKEDNKFEELIECFITLKNIRGFETAKEYTDPVLRMVTNGDEELMEIFYASAEGWEKEQVVTQLRKILAERKLKKIESEPEEEE